jgi:hypothetical protein
MNLPTLLCVPLTLLYIYTGQFKSEIPGLHALRLVQETLPLLYCHVTEDNKKL